MAKVRELGNMYKEQMWDLAQYAFHFPVSSDRRARLDYLIDNSWNYGVFSDTQLTSQIMVTPFSVNFHETQWQMGGVGFVASYPEFRG